MSFTHSRHPHWFFFPLLSDILTLPSLTFFSGPPPPSVFPYLATKFIVTFLFFLWTPLAGWHYVCLFFPIAGSLAAITEDCPPPPPSGCPTPLFRCFLPFFCAREPPIFILSTLLPVASTPKYAPLFKISHRSFLVYFFVFHLFPDPLFFFPPLDQTGVMPVFMHLHTNPFFSSLPRHLFPRLFTWSWFLLVIFELPPFSALLSTRAICLYVFSLPFSFMFSHPSSHSVRFLNARPHFKFIVFSSFLPFASLQVSGSPFFSIRSLRLFRLFCSMVSTPLPLSHSHMYEHALSQIFTDQHRSPLSLSSFFFFLLLSPHTGLLIPVSDFN